MGDLIEALNIFRQVIGDKYAPTHCEHDVLLVVGVGKNDLSDADKARLDELGFIWMREYDCFGSFRFGSA